ncbi:hypothetical protein D3C84_785610 [compost metagenome]
MQRLEDCHESAAAGVRQITFVHRRLPKLIDQYLGQTLVGVTFGDLHVASGEVLEDRFEDVADRQRAGLLWQFAAQRRRQANRTVVDRLVAIEAVFGLGRYPHRILRRRHETAVADFHVQHAIGRILERAPRMPVCRGVLVGVEIGVAEIDRGWQFGEVQQINVFTVHAVRHPGQIVWIEV